MPHTAMSCTAVWCGVQQSGKEHSSTLSATVVRGVVGLGHSRPTKKLTLPVTFYGTRCLLPSVILKLYIPHSLKTHNRTYMWNSDTGRSTMEHCGTRRSNIGYRGVGHSSPGAQRMDLSMPPGIRPSLIRTERWTWDGIFNVCNDLNNTVHVKASTGTDKSEQILCTWRPVQALTSLSNWPGRTEQ